MINLEVKNLLIIAAIEFELSSIRKMLNLSESQYQTFGVGALNAAWNARELAKKCVDKDVIFVGTCGLFSDVQNISPMTSCEIVKGAVVEWLPTCERHQLSYSIPNLTPILNISSRGFPTLRPSHVLCAPNISTSSTLLQKDPLNDRRLYVENIECYSVVHELLPIVKSLNVLLGITNNIGANAHREWKKNHLIASERTAEILKNELFRKEI